MRPGEFSLEEGLTVKDLIEKPKAFVQKLLPIESLYIEPARI